MTPTLTPLARRRLHLFRTNRRGFYSLWIFLALFILSLFAEVIANDKPIIMKYNGSYYFPVFVMYSEKTFGGDFETEASYRDPYLRERVKANGWMLWPVIHYGSSTINYDLTVPAPSPPTHENLLGT